jgi:hypothetical protein
MMFLMMIKVASLMLQPAVAAPRMDTGVGTQAPLLATVVPDHEDPHLYYVFPQSSETATRADGKLEFLYVETWKRRWGPDRLQNAEARLWVRPSIESDVLKQKVAEIKAADPAARFAVVTIFKSQVVGSDSTERYFDSSSCHPIAGPLEVPVYCRLEVNVGLAAGFRTLIRYSQARVFHYVYSFYGMAGSQLKEYTFAVPLKLGMIRDAQYFVDQHGRELGD